MNLNKTLQTDNRKKQFYYGYIIEIACFLILVTNVGAYSAFGVLFKPLLNEFGWARAATSGAVSLTLITSGVIGILLGHLTDRFGPRLVVLPCCIIAGIGYWLMSEISSLWQLYLYYGLLIAMGIGILVPLMSTITRWFTKNRTLMVGIAISSGGVGGFISPLLINWITSNHGWSYSYKFLGILLLVVNTGAALLLKRNPPSQLESQTADIKPVQRSEGYSLKETVVTPYFWILVTTYVCFSLIIGIFQLHTVVYLTDINFSSSTAAGVYSLMSALYIVGCVVLGYISDRVGNRKFFIITLLMGSIAILGFIFIRQLWLIYLFAILFGLSWGSSCAHQSPLLANAYGVKALGVLLGIVSFGFNVGSGLGGVLAGYVFDTTGSYQLIFVIGTILGGISMILMMVIKPPRRISSRPITSPSIPHS